MSKVMVLKLIQRQEGLTSGRKYSVTYSTVSIWRV